MRRLGLIQPGRAGDIIICLPIAKYYFDKGYEIIWPVLSEYYDCFRDISYVNPVRLDCDISFAAIKAMEICRNKNCEELDLSFGFSGSEASEYHYDLNYSNNFVYAKYKLAKVPIEERWNLQYNRNRNKELELYNKVVKKPDYILVHADSSRGQHLYSKREDEVRVQKIEGYNIFNWMKIIEDAKEVHCVDSSICNLVESQKHLYPKVKKYIGGKKHAVGWGRTTLDNNWIIL
jgi:hypothetical protein